MERLTKRLNDGKELCIDVCGEKCVDGYTWCPKCKPFTDVMKKLAEYEDAEEQGLLLRLPLKRRDRFWELNTVNGFPHIYPRMAHSLQHCVYVLERLGKTTFLTKEEAEQAMKKMEKNNNE